MTGEDFQDRLDAVVEDLQTKGKGKTINIMFRNEDNTPQIMPLSSDASGTINAAELSAIQFFLGTLKDAANEYEEFSAPVGIAGEAFKIAQTPHESLMTAATAARKTLSDALEADPAYQAAKTSLDTARQESNYLASLAVYKSLNVSENYAELQNAKGKYA